MIFSKECITNLIHHLHTEIRLNRYSYRSCKNNTYTKWLIVKTLYDIQNKYNINYSTEIKNLSNEFELEKDIDHKLMILEKIYYIQSKYNIDYDTELKNLTTDKKDLEDIRMHDWESTSRKFFIMTVYNIQNKYNLDYTSEIEKLTAKDFKQTQENFETILNSIVTKAEDKLKIINEDISNTSKEFTFKYNKINVTFYFDEEENTIETTIGGLSSLLCDLKYFIDENCECFIKGIENNGDGESHINVDRYIMFIIKNNILKMKKMFSDIIFNEELFKMLKVFNRYDSFVINQIELIKEEMFKLFGTYNNKLPIYNIEKIEQAFYRFRI